MRRRKKERKKREHDKKRKREKIKYRLITAKTRHWVNKHNLKEDKRREREKKSSHWSTFKEEITLDLKKMRGR